MFDIGLFGGIAGAIGGIASTILGNNSAKHEAEKNRQFQEQMSNTSISRRMQDLRNSGLNPLLAVENASSGASTPSGSQAQLTKVDPSWIAALSSAKLQKQQGEVAKAEERKVNAEAEAQENDNKIFEYKAEKLKLEAERERQGVLNDRIMNKILNAKNENERLEIYKKSLESKGIDISNKKASEELNMLMFENNEKRKVYENFPDLMQHEIIGKNTTNPFNSIGFGLSILDRLINRTPKQISKEEKKEIDEKTKRIRKYYMLD